MIGKDGHWVTFMGFGLTFNLNTCVSEGLRLNTTIFQSYHNHRTYQRVETLVRTSALRGKMKTTFVLIINSISLHFISAINSGCEAKGLSEKRTQSHTSQEPNGEKTLA